MAENSEETIDDSENESKSDSGPFLTRAEAAKRIGISVSKLRTVEAVGRIEKPQKRTGYSVPVFPESVIDEYIKDQGGDTPENALGDLLRAARDLLAQEQGHGQKMFDKHMAGFNDIYTLLKETISKQHDHIMNLEKQAFEMREAADKVLNLEHERKMAEMRETRKEAMQAVAIKQVMQIAGPILSRKFGVQLPTVSQIEPPAESQEALLGQAVIGMLINMTDEKFASLQGILGEDAFSVLKSVRTQAKGTES